MNRRRALVPALAVLALAAALTGCKPEPVVPTATPLDPSPLPTATATATPTPTPTATPSADIELPASCEDVFSDAFLAGYAGVPLNDPGFAMLSTELVEGLEIMDVAPTIRCTWGSPSESGIATNVTLIAPEERDSLLAAFQGRGFACEDRAAGEVRCTAETRGTSEMGDYAYGEVQVFRGNAWITTRWLNADIAGYADDIVATLWG